MQAGKEAIFSKFEHLVNAIKSKQASYAMWLLSVVILCFIVGAGGCIGDREPVSQEGELNFEVIPEKTRVVEGEIFIIELILTNTGDTTVNVWEMEEQVSYDIFFLDSNGSYVPYECGVIERVQLKNEALVELQPGEFLEARLDSGCWTFPPVEYTLLAEYHTSAGESITKPYWIGRVRSNSGSIFVEVESAPSLPESNVDVPVTIEVSSLVEYLSPEDLAKKSNLILIGSVKEILPARWNTPDGKPPENAFEGSGLNDVIYRDVVISVDQYLKNPLSSNEVVVRMLGGTVGNLTLDVEDEPSFEPGEDVLLYLVEDTKPATKDLEPEHFRVTGSFQGKYTLTGDGKAVKSGETADLGELLKIISNVGQS